MSDIQATIIDARADDLSPLAGHWEVDPTHSALEFVARHAVFTLVRGRFTSFTGTLVIGPPHLGATRIDVDIDASSVDTAMAVRDTNLRSEEFFDVERAIPRSPSSPGTRQCSPPVATRCAAT